MKRVRWTGRRWASLLTTACLFALSVGLFNHYRQLEQVKRTGKPIGVLVVVKEQGRFRQASKVIVRQANRAVVVATRSRAFFLDSKPGKSTTVLDGDGSWVAPDEPTGFPFVLIAAI